MSPSNTRSDQSFQSNLSKHKPSIAFVTMILGALIAFEIFNYSTTDHALGDLLGNLTFAGIQWSTILALAFCGIDFAGIARLFTPEQGADEPKEVWYLFGAWLLAATMNAILTWWGVSMAVTNHSVQSSSVIDSKTLTSVVPVFVAIMVWVIRILIIGTLSLAMDRLLHPGTEQRIPLQGAIEATAAHHQHRSTTQQVAQPTQPMHIPASLNSSVVPPRPSANMPRAASSNSRYGRHSIQASSSSDEEYIPEPPARNNNGRPEPTYHTLSMSARPANPNGNANENGANRFRRS